MKLKKPKCFKEIDRKCLKYVETQRAIGCGGLLVSCWLENPEGNVAIMSPLSLGHFLNRSATM
jgi:hypothetical protein